ncbi:RagB/SusD family nutrient uptake outer membrane protein [Puteibacter caeruleilacunae]|nr:RagB/SusD family nutrient uptake outer membrane protein [Puteibacter caeruleilacunae]
MKNIIIGLMVTLGLAMTSCSDVLDEDPKSFLTVDNFYQNRSDVETALTGIYSLIADADLYGMYISQQADLGTDAGYWVKANSSYMNYNITPTTGTISKTWLLGYKTIYAINKFIEQVEPGNFDDDYKASVIGQARFIRGLVYFELVRLFGELPIVDKVMTLEELNAVSRDNLTDVYQFIIDDLNYAKTSLLALADMGQGDGGRASKNAAMAILAKVYATMAGKPLEDTSKWTDAAAEAKALIDLGFHQLNPSFPKIWDNIKKDIFDYKECIFEIAYTAGPATGNNIGTWMGIPTSKGPGGVDGKNFGGGYAYAKATKTLRMVYGENGSGYDASIADSRYHQTAVPYKLDGSARPSVDADGNYKEQKDWALCKYRKENSNGAYHYNLTGINYPVIRYADVLLIYAEAENELNGTGRSALANDVMAQVRQRAFRQFDDEGNMTQLDDEPVFGESLNYDYAAMNEEDFRYLLKDERLRELAGEGHRRNDLVRWGELYATVRSLSGSERGYCWDNVQPHHVLFAIPQNEIDMNGNLTQNQGY